MLTPGGLEYETRGEGEAVLLIHGALIAGSFLPLMQEPALARYRLIRYHRRGFAGSAPHTGPFSFADQARDALQLLDGLGVEGAHLVGHSFGACIALEMARQAPEAVQSLVLLDPAPLLTRSDQAARQAVQPIVERYAGGDAPGAVDAFLSLVGGTDWRTRIDALVPGAAQQAVRDAATFFEVELPAIGGWSFDAAAARGITQPALHVMGTGAGPAAAERRQLVHDWLPQTEDFDVEANHLLHFYSREAATRVAEGISAFLKRYAGSASAIGSARRRE